MGEQLNATLEGQLRQFQGHLESESDYGVQLERLKADFEKRIESDRRTQEKIKERYERLVWVVGGGLLLLFLFCQPKKKKLHCAAA